MSEVAAATEKTSSDSPRTRFQRGIGAILFADVNVRTMEHIAVSAVEPMSTRDLRYNAQKLAEAPHSMAALYMVVTHLNYIYRSQMNKSYDGSSFYERYGISKQDLSQAREYTHEAGFADMDFPWSFAGAAASATAQQFIEDGLIGQEQYDSLTLQDWADLIGSVWFSDLMKDMAATRNGVYQQTGQFFEHYNLNYFQKACAPDGDEKGLNIFKSGWVHDEGDGRNYLVTKLSSRFRDELRKQMHSTWSRKDGTTSSGCPAARRKAVIPTDLIRVDSHVQNLLQRNLISLQSTRNEDTTAVIQELAAIDINLLTLANKLDEYSRLIGEPTIIDGPFGKKRLIHISRMPTGALASD